MAASNEHASARRAPAIFLLHKGQACAAIFEMDVALLHSDSCIDQLIKKLDAHFLEDKNQSTFICYKNFESEPHVSINNYLIEFEWLVLKLREFQIMLPEPVLAYCALKSANLSERLTRVTITNLTLSDMAQLKKKINGNSTLVNISQWPITVKKKFKKTEIEVAYSHTEDEILYGQHFVNKQATFSSSWTRGTNNKKEGTHNFTRYNGRYSRRTIQTVDANSTMRINPNSKINDNKRQTTENMLLLNEYENNYHKVNASKTCEKIANLVLINQEKLDNSTFIGQIINSTILDSGEATTVCGKKWLDYFLETTWKRKENSHLSLH